MLVRSLLLFQICRLVITKLTFSKETVTRKGNAIISQKEESRYCNYDYACVSTVYNLSKRLFLCRAHKSFASTV